MTAAFGKARPTERTIFSMLAMARVEHAAEGGQEVLRRGERRVEGAQVGGDVAAGDEVVAAAREQEDPPAGPLERVEVLAGRDHVVEGVAGLGAAVDGEVLEDPVDHVLEDEGELEPAVAFGGDQRALVGAAVDDLLEARLAAQLADEVGAVEELGGARAALEVGRRRHLDRLGVELQLGPGRGGGVLVELEVLREILLRDREVGDLAAELLDRDLGRVGLGHGGGSSQVSLGPWG